MSSNSSFKSEYGYFTEYGREYVITRMHQSPGWMWFPMGITSSSSHGPEVATPGDHLPAWLWTLRMPSQTRLHWVHHLPCVNM